MLLRVKKSFKVIIAIIMTFSFFTFSVCAADIDHHWANKQIQKWIGYSIVKGYKNGDFKPNDFISRAELYSLINRVLNNQKTADSVLKGITEKQWFYNEIQKGIASEYLLDSGDNGIQPNKPVTRQEAAKILMMAFGIEAADNKTLAAFKDAQQIEGWARDAVETMAAHRIINGYADQTFRPLQKLTRAEVVAILDKLCGEIYHTPDSAGPSNRAGSLMVNKLDTVLKEIEVGGSLFVTEGVENSIRLEQLTIANNLYLKNVCENTIDLVNIKAGNIVIKTPAAYRTLNKKGTVNIEAKSVFKEMHLYTATSLNIEEDVQLDKIIIFPQAIGTEINTKAALKVTVNADNVAINGKKAEKGSVVITQKNKGGSATTASGSTTSTGSAGSGNSEAISSFELIDVTDGK